MSERGGARGRTATWPPHGPAPGYRPALPWSLKRPHFGPAQWAAIWQWLGEDVGPGRLVPWFPVAFAVGIIVYFTAEHEPALWAGPALLLVFALAAWLARARPIAFPALVGIAAIAAGFATATLKAAIIGHPVLHHVAGNVALAGWVEAREVRERTDRIVVRLERIEGGRLDEAPERVRLSVRKGASPPVGTFIELKARLNAPLAPLRPGGYDFARDLYFQGIGATGLALGEIKIVEAPRRGGFWLAYARFMESLRDGIDRRIRAAVPRRGR